MRRVILLVFVLLLSAFVAAEDIAIALSTDKGQYQVGEKIKVTVKLIPGTTPYPFKVVGPDIFVGVSDPANVNMLNAFDSRGQNIYRSHLKSGAKSPIYWEFLSPLKSAQVTAQKHVIGSFSITALAETNDFQFFVADSTKVLKSLANNGISYSYNSEPKSISIGCDGECPAVVIQDQGSSASTQIQSSSGGIRSGNTNSCLHRWSCSDWSTCDSSGEQARECTDLNKCKEPKTETRECGCQESWVCLEWSECSGNQKRKCVEENQCGTDKLKPEEKKECGNADSPPLPARTVKEFPPELQGPSVGSLWDRFGYALFIMPLTLLMVAGIIILVIHFMHKTKHHEVHDHAQLTQWIDQEKKAGTPPAHIKEMLMKETGWNEQQIMQAFPNLSSIKSPQTI